MNEEDKKVKMEMQLLFLEGGRNDTEEKFEGVQEPIPKTQEAGIERQQSETPGKLH